MAAPGCSVPRCSETACKQSFHKLPVDPDRRDQWLAFLYRDREIPAFLSPRIRVCSLHFADDCFINLAQVNLGFGMRLLLKPDSVPTIYPVDRDTGVLLWSMERGASHPTKRPLSSTPHLPRAKRKQGRNRKEDLMDTSSSRGKVFNSKAILYESCIKELFRKCQCCGKPITDTHVTYVGAQMRVSWECLGGHSGTWTSTPEVRGMPEMSKSDGCVSSHSISPQQSSGRNACGTNPKERNSSLVRIKEEPEEELLQRPEEAAGSTQTLPGVKGEDDADEHMKTQAYINYWVPSDDHSESDITEDSDGWEETMEEDQPTLNKLNSHAPENMEGQRLSLSNELSRDLPSQPCPPTSAQTEEASTEQQEMSPSMVQVRLEPLQIKEEQQEELHGPEEAAVSTLTSLAVKSEDDEPLASTSTEHMKTQADVEDCGTSSQQSNSEDSDFWEETREDRNLKSSKQTLSAGRKSIRCTVCGRVFSDTSLLKRHMRTHAAEKPFS